MIERRRHYDPTPRCTYAQTTIVDRCKLVRASSPTHAALIELGFESILVADNCALMLAPEGFEVAQDFTVEDVRRVTL